jgi:hypothetical protein
VRTKTKQAGKGAGRPKVTYSDVPPIGRHGIEMTEKQCSANRYRLSPNIPDRFADEGYTRDLVRAIRRYEDYLEQERMGNINVETTLRAARIDIAAKMAGQMKDIHEIAQVLGTTDTDVGKLLSDLEKTFIAAGLFNLDVAKARGIRRLETIFAMALDDYVLSQRKEIYDEDGNLLKVVDVPGSTKHLGVMTVCANYLGNIEGINAPKTVQHKVEGGIEVKAGVPDVVSRLLAKLPPAPIPGQNDELTGNEGVTYEAVPMPKEGVGGGEGKGAPHEIDPQ